MKLIYAVIVLLCLSVTMLVAFFAIKARSKKAKLFIAIRNFSWTVYCLFIALVLVPKTTGQSVSVWHMVKGIIVMLIVFGIVDCFCIRKYSVREYKYN